MKYEESEEEPVVEQASGNSFEEIDKAVETASKPNATNEEMFSCWQGVFGNGRQ